MKLILGGPGCGKTTRLLRIVAEEIESGIEPEEIAFVAFTKAAAEEAKMRAASQFGFDPEERLPWFRTIHSMAYRLLGLTRDEILDKRDWGEFSEWIGEPITGAYDDDTGVIGGLTGDRYLRVVDYAATTLLSLEDAYHIVGPELDWFGVLRFADAFDLYKEHVAKLDFTDMLIHYVRESGPRAPVRVAIIDEGQDLTPAQWSVVRYAFKNCDRVYIGGDDDQAIYRWAGADVDHFLALSDSPEVLAHSFRLPRRVYEMGMSITKHIKRRYRKLYRPDDREGDVQWHQDPESVPIRELGGSWLLLARNGYMLDRLRDVVRGLGIPYSTREGPAAVRREAEAIDAWQRLTTGASHTLTAPEVRGVFRALGRPKPALKELARYDVESLKLGRDAGRSWFDAFQGIPRWRLEYYLECIKSGYDLFSDPMVKIETIHGVKGAEADHVLMMTDMSTRTAQGYELEPDHEHRVFYVGATRARETLHLIAPQTYTYYTGLSS